jgi:hypothetical protein
MYAATPKQPINAQALDVLDPVFMDRYIAATKAGWRAHARQMTWEEKIASIEKMWARDRALKVSRESTMLKPSH